MIAEVGVAILDHFASQTPQVVRNREFWKYWKVQKSEILRSALVVQSSVLWVVPLLKLVYFIYTEIFASNFAVWKGVSDFTLTNQRGETSFSHLKKSFRPITNHGLTELCFHGLLAVIAGSFVGQLWQRNIFGVLEFFLIQTYQEPGCIFEDGWISVCIK